MKKFAVVTGANSGIGKSFAVLFAKRGYPVILIGRKTNVLEEMTKMISKISGEECIYLSGDFCIASQVRKVVEALKEYPIGFFVNNAGFGTYGPFLNQNKEMVEDMILVNVAALTRLSYAAIEQMTKQGYGHLINVASVASFMPNPYGSAYAATKAYVRSFSEALYQEVKKSPITVTTLCPGPTRTNFGKRSGMGKSRSFVRMMSADKVAWQGYRAALAGKRCVVPGLLNKIVVTAVQILPKEMVLKAVMWALQERRKKVYTLFRPVRNRLFRN